MAVNEEHKSQIKSKERVSERGEVFTAEREVNAMLDLVANECLRPDSRFLEPACGDGNFLSAILKRKLAELRRKYKIKVIVVPHYETTINFNDKRYMNTDNYHWLGRSIIKKLKYKAFQQGMVVTSIRPYHISDTCSECGLKIKKYNEGHTAGQKYLGGKLFVCPNGHQGNTAYNTAKNIGKSFLSYWK